MITSRFAPSPTGRLHLGHAWSALLAHDFARERGGIFLLRIEDIDPGRSRPEHVEAIVEDLAWLGLNWDGEMLFQSRRLPLYSSALDRLKALDLVSKDGKATGVPSDGWGQLLIYRKDVFDKAGLKAPATLEDVTSAAKQLNGKDGMVGITLATAAGDGFTAETFEHVALAEGCQMVNDAGDVTFDSPECVEALRWYGDLASNYSVEGAQDVDSTRGTRSVSS